MINIKQGKRTCGYHVHKITIFTLRSDRTNMTGEVGKLKYSPCSSVIKPIILDGVLIIRKLQDTVYNRRSARTHWAYNYLWCPSQINHKSTKNSKKRRRRARCHILMWIIYNLSAGKVRSRRVVGGFSLLRPKRRHFSGHNHPGRYRTDAAVHRRVRLLLQVRPRNLDPRGCVCSVFCALMALDLCVLTGGRVSRRNGSTRRWNTSWRIWRKAFEIAARRSSQVNAHLENWSCKKIKGYFQFISCLILVAHRFYWFWQRCIEFINTVQLINISDPLKPTRTYDWR